MDHPLSRLGIFPRKDNVGLPLRVGEQLLQRGIGLRTRLDKGEGFGQAIGDQSTGIGWLERFKRMHDQTDTQIPTQGGLPVTQTRLGSKQTGVATLHQ